MPNAPQGSSATIRDGRHDHFRRRKQNFEPVSLAFSLAAVFVCFRVAIAEQVIISVKSTSNLFFVAAFCSLCCYARQGPKENPGPLLRAPNLGQVEL